MKAQIEEASKKKSKISLVTDFISISGAVFSIGTIIFSFTEFNKPLARPDVLFVSGAFGLAASSALLQFLPSLKILNDKLNFQN